MTAVIFGILIPLLGTALGAAFVFLMWKELRLSVQSALSGFAAGIMTAASVWSLLIPAIERSAGLGTFAFLPAAMGLLCGVMLLLWLDAIVPRLYSGVGENATSRMIFAVTLHNLPEGMAVGAVFAGVLAGEGGGSMAAGVVLAIGVAVQNIPEGAIISMPLRARGASRGRAFAGGALSGAVEPIGAALTLLAARVILPVLPFLLGLAAGAMLYVVAEELIPEVAESGHGRVGTVLFAVGFAVMMALDVALG